MMENSVINFDKAKEVLQSFASEAEELLHNPDKVEELLQKAEEKLKSVPAIGGALSKLPLMISMIRAYIRRDYGVVSVKVIVSMLCAVIYLLKGKDLIPDKTPILGYADDIAVMAAALYFVQPELEAYSAWREGDAPEAVIEVPEEDVVEIAVEEEAEEVAEEA
ncbi:MAG: DUF1232 domain-containing protein [Lachnospiraceae bacterium]|nr:DUF1232 domain-containing protein [Lachnospiraceae bacterium]